MQNKTENKKSKQKEQIEDRKHQIEAEFNRPSGPLPDPSPREVDPEEMSGTNEDSLKAAMGGTGAVSEESTGYPKEVPHRREETH